MNIAAEMIAAETPRRPGRPKVRPDEEQRRLILAMAMDVYLQQGFTASRMDDLANLCRISKRTLYRFFPSKLELFAALVREHRASMIDFPPGLDRLPLDEALCAIFRVDLDPVNDRRRVRFMERALSDARGVPALMDVLETEGGDPACRQLADWLAVRRTFDRITAGDSVRLATMLMDMAFGAMMHRPTVRPQLPGGHNRQVYLRECIRYFVNGIR
jgi:AcrR family transcriptional regulator